MFRQTLFARLQPAALPLAGLIGLGIGTRIPLEEPKAFATSGFALEHEVVVPGSPAEVFDLFTGDVRPWWDHHFSENPHKLVIEPRPGGGFVELFDEEGNGALHATVTIAKRGEELVFRGPLGFGRLGVHLDFVHRFVFTADGENTKIHLTVHGAGELQPEWPQAVQQVWKHFLDERFKPYVEAQRKGGSR